ncbi:unnamed protein product [Acanthosepion pharaonis]|uniref:mRNA-decapping enzyme C-terminal domain-containing protein n=1 Tax=Acanthosepion pharaonis TaxID=158019 RepID=A0A812CYT9_ACAPH|nr:unnamed protein product [Sepia pharaonis]
MSIVKNELTMDHQIRGSVDIIQLLSKAQHEYNKMREDQNPEPILMTDKPNKSIAYSSSIIRPTPVHMLTSTEDTDSEMGVSLEDRTEENQTSHISLEVLFHNASIKHIENQQTNSHTMRQTKAIQSCVLDEAETVALLSTNSKGDNSATFSHTCLSSPILGKTKSQNLLTPADIETIPSSIISAMGMSGCSGVGSETLLSPMAFVSQTRMTSSSSNSSDMAKIKNESNLTPLTKEQLQEALLYIIKNDSSLVSRIHEAYFLKLNNEISNPIM